MINWLKNNKLSLTIGLFIVIISIVPSSGLPRYNIAFADKIVHIAMYFTLTLAFFIDHFIITGNIKPKFKRIVAIVLLTMVVGILLETIQSLLPERSASFNDILANFAGVLLATLLIFIIYTIKRQ